MFQLFTVLLIPTDCVCSQSSQLNFIHPLRQRKMANRTLLQSQQTIIYLQYYIMNILFKQNILFC